MSEINERDPNRVLIFDTTLRDGDQTPGVNFGIEEKEEIAKRLTEAGVDIIEAGFPFAEEGDFEAVRNIAENVDGPVIVGLSRAKEQDIEAAWSAIEPAKDRGGARIHTFIGTSPVHMESNLKMTPDQVIDSAAKAVRFAKTFTDDVEFSAEDATRSDPKFMIRVILEAVENGATTINIPDTVGYAHPQEYAERIAETKKVIESIYGIGAVVMSVHCHDDLGMATANTVAAINAGARQAEVTVNGLGERAGNTSLEQVAANIKERGGDLWTQIKTERLTALSKFVAEKSGIYVPPNTAVVGDNAFAHESGIHQRGVSENAATYEHMRAQEYGQKPGKMVIGKLSGKAGVESRLKSLAISATSEDLLAIRKVAKRTSDKFGRTLVDSDLEQLATKYLGIEFVDHIEFNRMTVVGEETQITINNQGFESTHTASSDKGTIDAAVQAVNKALGFDGDIESWHGDSMNTGSDSIAGITVTVKKNGYSVSARSEDASVDQASVKAYIKAINIIERIEQRKTES